MKFKLFGGKEAPLLEARGVELELHKHFKLVRKLGRGSFATVYEAERLTDGQRYALKVTELAALSRLNKQAVVEEIRLLASLRHPALVTYYEAFCDHDKLCVVTELVQGGDLGSFLGKVYANEDFLWERQVWSFFLQAALGVQYLHRNHVLHRDLKPQNIMLTRKGGDGLLKIVDLGVSAELARVFTNVQIGTPHYMAPEMWQRKAYSYSADVWALGCVLHELCTLRPAFLSPQDRTEQDIKRRVLEGRVPPIHTRYSLDLRNLVDAMLRPDPKERPTIDEIMHRPEVRSKFPYLPLELQRLAEAQQGASEGTKLHRGAQAMPDDSRAFNCLLPPAQYPTGSGVAELLCGAPRRRSLSLPDLQAAAQRQRAAGAGAELDAAHAAAAAVASSGSAGDGGAFADGSHVHKSGSMSTLDEEEAERRLRRRSIMVGDLLFRLQQEQAQEQAAAAAAAEDGGQAAAQRRLQRRSHDASDLGRSHARRSGGGRALSPPGHAAPQLLEGREGEDCSLHAGMAYRPEQQEAAPAAPRAGRGSVTRHSVAVAEVLFYHEATSQGAKSRGPDPLPKPKPLPREPFEFCATSGTAASGSGSGGSPAGAAAPPAPRSALLAQLATGQAGGGGIAVQHPPQPGTPAGGGGGGLPAVAQPEEKKKKKHGRLWRLMYGEGDSSMHQPGW